MVLLSCGNSYEAERAIFPVLGCPREGGFYSLPHLYACHTAWNPSDRIAPSYINKTSLPFVLAFITMSQMVRNAYMIYKCQVCLLDWAHSKMLIRRDFRFAAGMRVLFFWWNTDPGDGGEGVPFAIMVSRCMDQFTKILCLPSCLLSAHSQKKACRNRGSREQNRREW